MLRPKRDSLIDAALRKALAGRVTKGSSDCPDENSVTMYLESRLDPVKKGQYEDHASNCPRCQQVLALAMKLAAVDEKTQGAPGSAGHSRLPFRFLLVPSGVAILVLAIGVLVFYQMKDPRKGPASEMAEHRPSVSREPQLSVGKGAPSQDAGTEVSGLKQEPVPVPKTSSARSRNVVPVPSGLTGTNSQVEQKRDELAHQKSTPATAPSAAPPVDAAPPAEGTKDARAGLAGSSVPRVGNLALKADGREITSLAEVQKRLEPPQTVLVAFSQRYLSDQGNVSALRLQDQSPGARNAQALDNAQSSKAANTQTRDRATAKIEEPESEFKWKVNARKQIGERVFFLVSGYWIDAECGKHPRVEVVEVSEGDARFGEIREAFPGITELRSYKVPVLIHWNGKNYVLQWQ